MPILTNVTVNTDASVRESMAGLAGWIVGTLAGERQPTRLFIQGQQPLPKPCTVTAELLALRLALSTMKKADWATPVIVWNCDSEGALVSLRHVMQDGNRQGDHYAIARQIWAQAQAMGIRTIYCRKVKAHTPGNDSRHYVNNKVDMMARRALGKKGD